MVTINLKISMCIDIVANSNITKVYVVILVILMLTLLSMQYMCLYVYSDYVMNVRAEYIHCTYIKACVI